MMRPSICLIDRRAALRWMTPALPPDERLVNTQWLATGGCHPPSTHRAFTCKISTDEDVRTDSRALDRCWVKPDCGRPEAGIGRADTWHPHHRVSAVFMEHCDGRRSRRQTVRGSDGNMRRNSERPDRQTRYYSG